MSKKLLTTERLKDIFAETKKYVDANNGGGAAPAAENCIALTWSELVALRDGATLKPGCFYRITDYVCSTTQADTRAKENNFEIILLALGADSLSEKGWAYDPHTSSYFKNNNLSAWEVWYCLDNDTKRFLWADEENGKGVIYRLIDEFGNDCPYDFKNIQFKRWKATWADSSNNIGMSFEDSGYWGIHDGVTTIADETDFKWMYTFSSLRMEMTSAGTAIVWPEKDMSLNAKGYYFGASSSEDLDFGEMQLSVQDNRIEKCIQLSIGLDDYIYAVCKLPNIVMFCMSQFMEETQDGVTATVDITEGVYSNTIGDSCEDLTFSMISGTSVGRKCKSIYLGMGTSDMRIGTGCHHICLKGSSSYIGDKCYALVLSNVVNSIFMPEIGPGIQNETLNGCINGTKVSDIISNSHPKSVPEAITQARYDQISHDAATLYYITEG